jgi:2-C-methyl-D-erythritol 4-phosphate cytidylyltransferase
MTIQRFEDCADVDEIVMVANENEIEYCRKNIVTKYGFTK